MRNRKLNLIGSLVLTGLLFFGFSAKAQIEVNTRLDSMQLNIGDQTNLYLEITTEEGVRLLDPEWNWPDSLEQIELLEVSNWDTLNSNGRTLYRKTYPLIAWDEGEYYLPKIRVPFTYKGTKQYTSSDEVFLVVRSQLTDAVDLAPMKPIMEAPPKKLNWTRILLIGGSALLLLTLIILLIRWINKKMTGPIDYKEKEAIIRPPHEIALEKLAALDGEALYQNGQEKEFQSRLTYILREYVEGRYQVPALEQTTDEIIRSLQHKKMESSRIAVLQKLLPMADLVKFAKAKPPQSFHEQAFKDVRNWIESSIPDPAEEQKEEEE
ncbi:MAG: hypothetical protein GYB31_18205 [Bacteroidetes bacterium]|nr:hypothetical protein [Bacteroidota bacterium]